MHQGKVSGSLAEYLPLVVYLKKLLLVLVFLYLGSVLTKVQGRKIAEIAKMMNQVQLQLELWSGLY